MPLYTFTITLMDTGLPYSDKEEAEKDAKEWGEGLAISENCMLAKVEVAEDES